VAQKLIEDAKNMWIAAAEQSDSADGLGIDGRIGLVHGLVDITVKSWVALLEAIIKGGGAFFPGPGSSTGNTPLPSETIQVPATPYARQIEADGPFVRVGMPTVTIPPTAITFDPEFLPAGLSEIRIILKDNRFIGSNFTGKIKLTSTSSAATLGLPDIVPDEKVVTVGL
jgi:hypothetical protein